VRLIIPTLVGVLLIGLAVGGAGCRARDLPQVTVVPPEILQPLLDEQATDDAAVAAGTMTRADWRINYLDRNKRLTQRFVGYMSTHPHRPIVTQDPDAPLLVWETCEQLLDDCSPHLSALDCQGYMMSVGCAQGNLLLEYPIAYYSLP